MATPYYSYYGIVFFTCSIPSTISIPFIPISILVLLKVIPYPILQCQYSVKMSPKKV